jgi:phosphoribosyl 1,2-cyclic phosphate phosphodiesterase
VPLPVVHYKLPVLGFRIGKVAYITDANAFAPVTWERLEGVEVLVINALRKESHLSHFNLDEALEVIERVGPNEAYLTHISHLMGKHRDVAVDLPRGVELGVDGLKISAT